MSHQLLCEYRIQEAITNKVILLVDQEINVREVVEVCLCDLAGWNVLTVTYGQEGLNLALTDQPNAIILDLSLPDMDGFAFLKALRNNPLTKRIPVVLLTDKARWYTPQLLNSWGVVGAIAKPFDPVILPHQIAQALGWQ
ncbi:MAG: response regulator [Chroococcales cyanobacterium]